MKIYKLQPPGGTISADSIDCWYDYFKGTGQIDGIDNLTTDQKVEELEKAGLINLYRNHSGYHAARREEEYADMKEKRNENQTFEKASDLQRLRGGNQQG